MRRGVKLMAPWFNQFKMSPCSGNSENSFCYCSFIQVGRMFKHDLLNTPYPSVLSPQLTASPPARTAAPAAARIPACAALASKVPAVRRWLQSRCTSAKEAVWGVFDLGPTLSPETNRGEGPQRKLVMPSRSRPHDLRSPDSLFTLCKC